MEIKTLFTIRKDNVSIIFQMPKKIIQIAVALSESAGSMGRERLYALTEDGEVYLMLPASTKTKAKWMLVEPIPETEKTIEPWRE